MKIAHTGFDESRVGALFFAFNDFDTISQQNCTILLRRHRLTALSYL